MNAQGMARVGEPWTVKVAMWSASGGWFNWERRFVRWAEANGFLLDYAINSDLEIWKRPVDGW